FVLDVYAAVAVHVDDGHVHGLDEELHTTLDTGRSGGPQHVIDADDQQRAAITVINVDIRGGNQPQRRRAAGRIDDDHVAFGHRMPLGAQDPGAVDMVVDDETKLAAGVERHRENGD